MKWSTVYLVSCVVGAFVPWIFLTQFLRGADPSPTLFFTSAFANPVSASVAADLALSALVALVLVFSEGRRLGMTNLWIYIPATLCVGLSFGLPLFLYFRARRLERAR